MIVSALILADKFCVYEINHELVHDIKKGCFGSLKIKETTEELLEFFVKNYVDTLNCDCNSAYSNLNISLLIAKLIYLLVDVIFVDINIDISPSTFHSKDSMIDENTIRNIHDSILFEKSYYDPCMNDAVYSFREIQKNTACPFAPSSRYWGAPNWKNNKSETENWRVIATELLKFLIVSRKEKLDGFIVSAPSYFSENIESLACFFAKSLKTLSSYDSKKSNCLNKEIDCLWNYEFEGEAMFISVFGTCYDRSNPRFTFGQSATFLFFQPNHTLRFHPSLIDGKEPRTRKWVAKLFENSNSSFSNEYASFEAARYIRPIHINGDIVQWWLYLNNNTK
jgi:hypothetical protein